PQETIEKINLLQKENKLELYLGSVSWPGLYHKGRIHVAPSKLEGLGLYIPEGLACGLPTITTDAPPMNQFVKDGFNGLVVKTIESHSRKDYGGSYYFPEYSIDIIDLKSKMLQLATDSEHIEKMSIHARQDILENNSFKNFKQSVVELVQSI
ncbi:MAG: glycosyltransferase, partial [bacterium]|nr:glycosyltransferase [bacterium]